MGVFICHTDTFVWTVINPTTILNCLFVTFEVIKMDKQNWATAENDLWSCIKHSNNSHLSNTDISSGQIPCGKSLSCTLVPLQTLCCSTVTTYLFFLWEFLCLLHDSVIWATVLFYCAYYIILRIYSIIHE